MRTINSIIFVIASKIHYLLSAGLVTIIVFAGCNKKDIPDEKHLLFEENFQGNYNWTINGSTDTSGIQSGTSEGEVNNGILSLKTNGCTEIEANLNLTSEELTGNSYKNMTVTVNIKEFYASPVIPENNYIEISFYNFYLKIKPLQNIYDTELIFNLHNNELSINSQTNSIEYTFDTSPVYNNIKIHLQSQGVGDCTSDALIKLNSIKIYKE